MERKKPAKTAKRSTSRTLKVGKATIKDLAPGDKAVKGGRLPPTKGCPKL